MTAATKAKAARWAPAALQNLLPDSSNDSADQLRAQDDKALAVWLYCHGAASLYATAAKFSRHPEWRSA